MTSSLPVEQKKRWSLKNLFGKSKTSLALSDVSSNVQDDLRLQTKVPYLNGRIWQDEDRYFWSMMEYRGQEWVIYRQEMRHDTLDSHVLETTSSLPKALSYLRSFDQTQKMSGLQQVSSLQNFDLVTGYWQTVLHRYGYDLSDEETLARRLEGRAILGQGRFSLEEITGKQWAQRQTGTDILPVARDLAVQKRNIQAAIEMLYSVEFYDHHYVKPLSKTALRDKYQVVTELRKGFQAIRHQYFDIDYSCSSSDSFETQLKTVSVKAIEQENKDGIYNQIYAHGLIKKQYEKNIGWNEKAQSLLYSTAKSDLNFSKNFAPLLIDAVLSGYVLKDSQDLSVLLNSLDIYSSAMYFAGRSDDVAPVMLAVVDYLLEMNIDLNQQVTERYKKNYETTEVKVSFLSSFAQTASYSALKRLMDAGAKIGYKELNRTLYRAQGRPGFEEFSYDLIAQRPKEFNQTIKASGAVLYYKLLATHGKTAIDKLSDAGVSEDVLRINEQHLLEEMPYFWTETFVDALGELAEEGQFNPNTILYKKDWVKTLVAMGAKAPEALRHLYETKEKIRQFDPIWDDVIVKMIGSQESVSFGLRLWKDRFATASEEQQEEMLQKAYKEIADKQGHWDKISLCDTENEDFMRHFVGKSIDAGYHQFVRQAIRSVDLPLGIQIFLEEGQKYEPYLLDWCLESEDHYDFVNLFAAEQAKGLDLNELTASGNAREALDAKGLQTVALHLGDGLGGQPSADKATVSQHKRKQGLSPR